MDELGTLSQDTTQPDTALFGGVDEGIESWAAHTLPPAPNAVSPYSQSVAEDGSSNSLSGSQASALVCYGMVN